VVIAIGAALATSTLATPAVADHPNPGSTAVSSRATSGASTQQYAQFSSAAAARGRTVHYAKPEHLCARPTAGQLSCQAVRLVPAAKGSRGAKAYVEPNYTTGPKGGLTPADLASAYGFDPNRAVRQTVAIVDAHDDPKALANLNAFDSRYGLPRETATSFRKVNQNGSVSPLPAADRGWASEIALDIEAVRAVCHRCRILLVEAAAATAGNLAAAVNTAARLGANEISNSYGGPESATASPSLQAAYNHPGVVITAATGDDGWYDWDLANEGPNGASANAPNAPAAYPTVVAVTGTALALNANGTRQHEDVWNENGPDDVHGVDPTLGWVGAQGASGGGCSTIYSAPMWQARARGYANTGCGAKRATGDIAALADPFTGFDVYDTYGWTGWATAGGTSLASPIVAAMWALAGGAHGARYPAQSLYDNLRFRSSSIYDVTLGGNSFCGGDSAANCSAAVQSMTGGGTGNPNELANKNPFYANGWAGLLDCGFPHSGASGTIAANTQCNAVSGYDGASGVGAANGLAMFTPTRPSVSLARPTVVKLNTAQTWAATGVTDPLPGGHPTGYRWNWGDGTSSVTSTASTGHTFTRAGTHAVTVAVTDNYGQTGSAATTVIVGVRPTAVISGPITVRRGTTVVWSSARSVDRNTGAVITSRRWQLGTVAVGNGNTWKHTFASVGRHVLRVLIGDNGGLSAATAITVTVIR
jgi:plastocyanin